MKYRIKKRGLTRMIVSEEVENGALKYTPVFRDTNKVVWVSMTCYYATRSDPIAESHVVKKSVLLFKIWRGFYLFNFNINNFGRFVTQHGNSFTLLSRKKYRFIYSCNFILFLREISFIFLRQIRILFYFRLSPNDESL